MFDSDLEYEIKPLKYQKIYMLYCSQAIRNIELENPSFLTFKVKIIRNHEYSVLSTIICDFLVAACSHHCKMAHMCVITMWHNNIIHVL